MDVGEATSICKLTLDYSNSNLESVYIVQVSGMISLLLIANTLTHRAIRILRKIIPIQCSMRYY